MENILVREKLTIKEVGSILQTTLANGGYSDREYNDGYMVGIEGTEHKINIHEGHPYDTVREIREFHAKHGTVNTWLDDNIIYLDVSVNVLDIRDAINLGVKNNQLAIYDCVLKDTIDLSIFYE